MISIKINGQPMDTSALTAGFAGSSVALPRHAGDFNNPAALASSSEWHVSFFANQGFGLPELRFAATQVTLPFAGHVIGFRVQGFGFDAYNESLWQISTGRLYFPGTSRPVFAGISFFYKHIAIRQYDQGGALGWQVGSLFPLWPNLYWGFTYEQALTNTEGVVIPVTGQVGFAFQPQDGLWFLASITKEVLFPFSVAMGAETSLSKFLLLRCGIATQPFRLSLGSSVLIKKLAMGMVAERHTPLGWTPGLSIDLQLTNHKAVR